MMVLVVGELLIDLITTDLVNDLSKAESFQTRVGGSAANFARFCSKLGTPVKLLATVGKDSFGDLALENLKSAGLSSDLINRLPFHNTSVIIVSKSHDTPEFIPYRDADQHIAPVAHLLIETCCVLHSTAFALSREPARDNILSAFEFAKKAGKQLSIDWNYAEKIWGPGNNPLAVFDQVMSYQPLLKMSMDDACRFWNMTGNVDEVKQKMDQYPFAGVCLTNGAAGVHYKMYGEQWKHKDNLPTNVIDVTGAGDAFWSGFITAWLSKVSMDVAVDNALSVAKCRLEQQI